MHVSYEVLGTFFEVSLEPPRPETPRIRNKVDCPPQRGGLSGGERKTSSFFLRELPVVILRTLYLNLEIGDGQITAQERAVRASFCSATFWH